jgi:lipopolysaccharide cholinephosphotransferase
MSFIAKIITLLTMILYPSLKGAVDKREKLFKSVPQSSRVVNNSGAWLDKEIIPRKWVQGTVEMEFEGIKVNVSDKYDEWLSFVYGDYMLLPPENERVGHHYVDVFDMNKSYTEYIN